ncbi:glycosyltransferase family 2 protein [Shouchella clausii]|uniref:glycosyltransferase family 2 protein n=1 Tax=Shouchella clausii TaxID=79880 RepID=UPI00346354F1
MKIISVISTVKNGEKYLMEMIDSIKNQSISFWELIVVDDGSEDNSLNILLDASNKDKRIKVIKTSGVGRGPALNMAIKEAKGNYIANIDVDDPSHPQRLEIQRSFLESNPELDCLFTNSLFVDGNEPIEWSFYNIDDILNSQAQIVTIDTLYRLNPLNHSSFFVKKSDLNRLGNYNQNRKSLLDYSLWFNFLENGYKIAVLPYNLASKRIHQEQSFESKNRLRYLNDTRKLRLDHINKVQGLSKYKYTFIANFMFLYGLFPQYIRRALKKQLGNKE